MAPPGLILAAPASGSGKTLATLGLLRRLRRSGIRIASAKIGPDYIDPAFHAAATGRDCLTLDDWAMRPETLAALVGHLGQDADMILAEGVMGLFDGAKVAPGETNGSTAELAARTGWPVVLILDCRGQGASAAAIVRGFAAHRPDVTIAGIILNRIASPAHGAIIAEAIGRLADAPRILGALGNESDLLLPSRHLGLVQAGEHDALEKFLDRAADKLGAAIDLGALRALARPSGLGKNAPGILLPPLGQKISIARDIAFGFVYPAILSAWRESGAELSFFSPLADEAPAADCDAVYLPGGYPELHAPRIAANGNFLDGLRRAAARGAFLFGECGGYMVLGRSLTDAEGRGHRMADLLPLDTSFARRKLHLGYRRVEASAASPLGPKGGRFRGHEFHYASVLAESGAESLFEAADAAGNPLGPMGLRRGSVAGSFVHLIDRA